MEKGLFIVFEGIDGAGKTTQVDMLAAALAKKGRSVTVTRDPGGTSLGESLRSVLLYSELPINPEAEALLYAAARAQLVSEKIIPALEQGSVVISDRFADSTLAYQGYGRGMIGEILDRINMLACRGLVPDLTVLMDMEPSGVAARLKRPVDRMEREGLEFLRRVRNGYLDLAGRDPGRYLVLDALEYVDQLFLRVLSAVERKLPECF
ncbi:MAG: dTMP kinase [Desulfocucumaceae bacterium]